MNQLAIITSLFVSMITCSFTAGLSSIYWATSSFWYWFPYYTLEGLIKAYYLTMGIELIGTLYLPVTAITYYMITE